MRSHLLVASAFVGSNAVTLLGVTDHFHTQNSMVTIDSKTAALTTVIKNFSAFRTLTNH